MSDSEKEDDAVRWRLIAFNRVVNSIPTPPANPPEHLGERDTPSTRRKLRLGHDLDTENVEFILEHEQLAEADEIEGKGGKNEREFRRIIRLLNGDSRAALNLRSAIEITQLEIASFTRESAEVGAAILGDGLTEWEKLSASEQRRRWTAIHEAMQVLSTALDQTPMSDASLFDTIPPAAARRIAAHVLNDCEGPIYKLPATPAQAISDAVNAWPKIKDGLAQLAKIVEIKSNDMALLQKGAATRAGIFVREMADWMRTPDIYRGNLEFRPSPRLLSGDEVSILHSTAELIFPNEIEDVRTVARYANYPGMSNKDHSKKGMERSGD